MTALRSFVKWTGIAIACLLGFGLAIYITLLFINRADEPPSDAYLAYAALVSDQSELLTVENAVVLMAGINAPDDTDPYELGAAWLTWTMLPMEARLGKDEPRGVPLRDVSVAGDVCRATRLARVCNWPTADCMTFLNEQQGVLRSELEQLAWLLERYEHLLQHSRWQEAPTAFDVGPINYADAFMVGSWYHAESWFKARAGGTEVALAMLDQEAIFWRMVLSDTSSLIGKMIAEARLRQNLAWTNALLRHFSLAEYNAGTWQQPLTGAERSLQRAFAGELHAYASFLRTDNSGNGELFSALRHAVTSPLFKQQATLNEIAGRYLRIEHALSADYPAVQNRIALLNEDESMHWRRFRAYNPVGESLYRIMTPTLYADYGFRVANLEGARRAFLLAAELRSKGVAVEALPEWIDVSEMRNPYTSEPFGWDQEAGAITFELKGRMSDRNFSLAY